VKQVKLADRRAGLAVTIGVDEVPMNKAKGMGERLPRQLPMEAGNVPSVSTARPASAHIPKPKPSLIIPAAIRERRA